MITVSVLVACGVQPAQARVFAEPLSIACERFAITTRPRVAGFLGQAIVETDGFTAMEELLYYRSPERIATVFKRLTHRGNAALMELVRKPQKLGCAAYAHINGNGDEASGDGWVYRGRGLPHLTGRGNYADAEAALGRPYISTPALVALPPDACLTGAWFFHTIHGNQLADSAQWDAITRATNGPAMLKRVERRSVTEEALQVLS
jgi:putative chitinase